MLNGNSLYVALSNEKCVLAC